MGIIFWLPILMGVLLDQGSKLFLQQKLTHGPQNVLPFLNFHPLWNRGVSFGLFSSVGKSYPWVLVWGPLALIILAVWLAYQTKNSWERICLQLIIAGGIGNWLDRVRFGKVFDFIDFHLGSWHVFGIFNGADILISMGFLGLVFRIFWPSALKS